MNAMNMPGFTAETSLYKATDNYRTKDVHGSLSGAVLPQRIKLREVQCECDTHTDICVCTNGRVFHLLLGELYQGSLGKILRVLHQNVRRILKRNIAEILP